MKAKVFLVAFVPQRRPRAAPTSCGLAGPDRVEPTGEEIANVNRLEAGRIVGAHKFRERLDDGVQVRVQEIGH